MLRLTSSSSAVACIEHDGYETPALNDKLYLHFHGFRKIENLEAYTGVKALWLDSNGIGKIEGIAHMKELRCLFLQQNVLQRIENLAGLDNLQTLNLSNNNLTMVENLSMLPRLQSLNLAKNALALPDSISHLRDCAVLNTLDLSDNIMEADESNSCVHMLAGVPKLVTLYLKGNPLVRDTRHYRKVVLAAMPKLRYLDERPVFEVERLAVDAWSAGGQQAEAAARKAYEDGQKAASAAGMERWRQWQEEIRARRAKELEELNAARRAEGQPEVTELPRRSYVSYGRVSTQYQTESMRLTRLSERAEALAREKGFHETALMELGREWWTSEGVLSAETGEEVPRHALGPDGQEVGQGEGELTEEGEEEEERRVLEEVERWERKRKAEEQGRTLEPVPEGDLGAVRESVPHAPRASHEEEEHEVAGGDENAQPLQEERKLTDQQLRVLRSLDLYKQRLAGAGEGAVPLADGKQEEEGEEEESLRAYRKSKGVQERIADARAEASSDPVPILPASSSAPAAVKEGGPATGAGDTAEHPGLGLGGIESARWWFPALDSALLKFVPQSGFDFEKSSKGLRSALLRGLLKPPSTSASGGTSGSSEGAITEASSSSSTATADGSAAGGKAQPAFDVVQTAAAALDATACRLRYTRLTVPRGVSVPSSPAYPDTPAPAAQDSTGTTAAPLPHGGTGVGSSRAPKKPVTADSTPGRAAGTRRGGQDSQQQAESSAAAARMVASLLPAMAASQRRTAPMDSALTEGLEGASTPPKGTVKPVSQLLQGDFSLDSFQDYVKPKSILPSMLAEGTEVDRERHVGAVGRRRDGSFDDEEEAGSDEGEEEEEPLTREQIMAKLRSLSAPANQQAPVHAQQQEVGTQVDALD